MPWWAGQIALVGAEACLVAGIVLGLFRLRHRYGFAPLYVTLGVLQLLQNLLTLSLRIDFGEITVVPGSVVVFPVTLFAVLLIYIREDASEARHLVYGLVAANLAMGILWAVFGFHLGQPGTINVHSIPVRFFQSNAGMSAIGLIVLFVDAILIIMFYEWLRRFIRRSLFARIFVAMTVILAFDSIVFVTAVFFRDPEFSSLLGSNLVGKTAVAFPLSALMAAYLTWVPPIEQDGVSTDTEGIRLDGFRRMSYRERYESMREQVVRDPLTGLYNRGFFDEVLPLTIERARRAVQPASLLMLDIDDFKQLNDTHGHLAGDAVLRKVGEVLTECARSEDAPCRFGGDEFALLLLDADGFTAKRIAERIRGTLAEVNLHAEGVKAPLAVTIGIATFPSDAETASELIALADRRLYRGKHRGGDALVDGQTTTGAA